jgi:hypothetical protein
VVNAPDREPVPGQPFEPYCRFDLCELDEPHVPTCQKHPDNVAQQREEEATA